MANEKTTREAHPAGGQKPPIDKETYEKIWSQYRLGKTYTEISEVCGVSRGTCEKYINEGDAKRGWEPLKSRLDNLTKCMQAKLFDHHSKKKSKYYQLADEAFEYALESAHAGMRRVKEHVCKDTDEDDKRYSSKVRVAKDLAELMTVWHGVLRALYVGEESERMLEDMQRFVELGEVTPSLREKVKEIVAKEEGATDK